MSAPADHEVDRSRISRAARAIRPYVRRTPTMTIEGDAFGLPGRLSLKLELAQAAGSFKARGAFANLLLRPVPDTGVVAASGGNHGVAVAWAAQRLSVPARVFVPEVSSPVKMARIQEYGADLVVSGDRYADALAASRKWAATSGAVEIHAYDQAETLSGAGTLARELEQQAPDLETVLVPVGGGGLIGGAAAWFAGSVTIVGVEPRLAPTLAMAMAAGRIVDAPAGGIAADSLAPQRVGELMFPLAQRYVDRVVLVDDDDIARAQRELWRVLRVVAEPGGATALAALLAGAYEPAPDEHVAVVVSGGNTTAVDFGEPLTR